ncbi:MULTISPECIES: hypothetical protein [Staphylococcus]|uniref:ABC transporter permease n=2 Tax=Staphylococcus TaxID=1279 RepID=A0ABY1H2K0_9STAP|nr:MULTISPECIES: hypothetical protein [Staphylococcus]ATH61946.1 hypothetical protein BJG87_02500 [Staphylococcus pasteuri]KKI56259.1 hypothetical protein UF70_1821 [Staphylococcus pasteuri]MCF7600126.1 hypothetical protein [Staphylococcus pasteuri]MCT1926589.1 hypothetical protein [Staphylococcus pasteuri]MDI3231684.1 hypothetical protein [Staphylococcus pasteuri]
MSNQQSRLENFDDAFQTQGLHRGKQYGKKKRSWVSMIIQLIVLVLTAITGYSMYKQPIFNIVFAKQTINFHQLKNFQDTVTQIGNININLGNIDQLQQSIDRLLIVFYAFFVLCILSLILSILTIIFNRSALKVVNMLFLAIMLVITMYFSYIIHTLAEKISDSLKQYYLTVSPDQVVVEADAIHNALILLACSIGLLIISLFFRNRKIRIK